MALTSKQKLKVARAVKRLKRDKIKAKVKAKVKAKRRPNERNTQKQHINIKIGDYNSGKSSAPAVSHTPTIIQNPAPVPFSFSQTTPAPPTASIAPPPPTSTPRIHVPTPTATPGLSASTNTPFRRHEPTTTPYTPIRSMSLPKDSEVGFSLGDGIGQLPPTQFPAIIEKDTPNNDTKDIRGYFKTSNEKTNVEPFANPESNIWNASTRDMLSETEPARVPKSEFGKQLLKKDEYQDVFLKNMAASSKKEQRSAKKKKREEVRQQRSAEKATTLERLRNRDLPEKLPWRLINDESVVDLTTIAPTAKTPKKVRIRRTNEQIASDKIIEDAKKKEKQEAKRLAKELKESEKEAKQFAKKNK